MFQKIILKEKYKAIKCHALQCEYNKDYQCYLDRIILSENGKCKDYDCDTDSI